MSDTRSDAPPDRKQEQEAQQEQRHKNDMYGDISARREDDPDVKPAIPAATVVLLRDSDAGIEVLMLRKSSRINYGGMWVFPGGKIDAEDAAEDDEATARNAAVREAEEEAGIQLEAESFSFFSHWTPPPGPNKRFATWFFAADVNNQVLDVQIDQGEIQDSAWLRPADCLARHAQGELEFVPPTWVTLYQLSLFDKVADAMAHFAAQPPRVYSTHVAKNSDGVRVAMWSGDAGYDAWDADVNGERHRLVMAEGGFDFQCSVGGY